MDPAA
jgi:hypothetical protein